MSDAIDMTARLSAFLMACKKLYYETATSPIDDATFDLLEEILYYLDPDSEYFQAVGYEL